MNPKVAPRLGSQSKKRFARGAFCFVIFSAYMLKKESNRERVGKREFPVEEGRRSRWKTVGFQSVR